MVTFVFFNANSYIFACILGHAIYGLSSYLPFLIVSVIIVIDISVSSLSFSYVTYLTSGSCFSSPILLESKLRC
jgi:hypothetical protein